MTYGHLFCNFIFFYNNLMFYEHHEWNYNLMTFFTEYSLPEVTLMK